MRSRTARLIRELAARPDVRHTEQQLKRMYLETPRHRREAFRATLERAHAWMEENPLKRGSRPDVVPERCLPRPPRGAWVMTRRGWQVGVEARRAPSVERRTRRSRARPVVR